MKILLAEDDAANVETVRLCLEAYRPDCTMSVVYNGNEVVSALEEEAFDGLILDLGLPGLDGMVVLEQVIQLSKIPIIVVTGRHIESERKEVFKLGAKDYIIKPYDFHNLLKSINDHFGAPGKAEVIRGLNLQ
jgi:DNA-binding response OmpR family regulator